MMQTEIGIVLLFVSTSDMIAGIAIELSEAKGSQRSDLSFTIYRVHGPAITCLQTSALLMTTHFCVKSSRLF